MFYGRRVEQCHNPRHKKNFIVTKAFENTAVKSIVSDLCAGLLVHPFYIAILAMGLDQNAENNTTISNTSFAILMTSSNFLSWGSYFAVFALTVDRFFAIYLHLRYQEFVTHKRAVAVVISIMVLSSFISSFPRWIGHDRRNIYIAIQILCLALNTILNCKIYSTVRRHKNQIQSLQVQRRRRTESGNDSECCEACKISSWYILRLSYVPALLFTRNVP